TRARSANGALTRASRADAVRLPRGSLGPPSRRLEEQHGNEGRPTPARGGGPRPDAARRGVRGGRAGPPRPVGRHHPHRPRADTTVPVHGLIGSEKPPFFSDPRVVAAFKRGGFAVDFQTAGSRQIALADLTGQDFAFPAGGPAAARIRQDHPGSVVSVPFYTP